MICDYRAFLKQLEIFHAVRDHTKGGKCYPIYDMRRTTSGRLASKKPAIQTIPANTKVYTYHSISDVPNIIMPDRPIWPTCKVVSSQRESGGFELVETSPNFKEIFRPDPGMTMLYFDYKQLEVVILANYITKIGSRDKTLQNAIIQGRDIHSYNCSLLYTALTGKTYTEDFIKSHKHIDPYKSWRSNSKSVLFKLIYGGTASSLATQMNMSFEEAKKLYDTFLYVIPGIKHYLIIQEGKGIADKGISTLVGHWRDLGIYNYENRNSKARNVSLNHPIQGTACYLVNMGLLKYHERLKEISHNSRILLTVHDSIASQVPNDPRSIVKGITILKWCAIDYLMQEYADFLTVPIDIDIEIGQNWHALKEVNYQETIKQQQLVYAT